MDHNDVRHKLSEYIDNAVTSEERAAIEEHLAACSTCSDALREIRKTIEHLHAVPEVEPPAWMRSKIMATVREERERKKSIFRRFFFPLAIKVPLQAVAVLFLAVTAFYIYQGIHPASRYAEEPQEAPARMEAPVPAAKALKRKTPEPVGRTETRALQSPGYKALDMKNEYERPAPPAPAAPRAGTAQEAAPLRQKETATRRTPMAAGQAQSAARSLQEERSAGAVPSLSDDLLRKEKKESDKEVIDDAKAMMDVTAYFTQHDLRPDMMVRGLQYSTRRLPEDLKGVEWLLAMRSYRQSSCRNRYLVEVELAGNSSKYLYCYHKGRISLTGAYDLVSGVWMERK